MSKIKFKDFIMDNPSIGLLLGLVLLQFLVALIHFPFEFVLVRAGSISLLPVLIGLIGNLLLYIGAILFANQFKKHWIFFLASAIFWGLAYIILLKMPLSNSSIGFGFLLAISFLISKFFIKKNNQSTSEQ